MKHLAIIILCLLFTVRVAAQKSATKDMGIQATIDACIAMRDAVAAGDSAAIRQSADSLRNCKTAVFVTLRCKDDTIFPMNGHLVFDESFADSIAEGKDVYGKVDSIWRLVGVRGQNADGSILTKTCFVKAGKSAKYTFPSKGHQELAVVAEAGGLVTMKIHVTNRYGFDRRYDDTKNVKRGMSYRKSSFELPTDKRNMVELEVVNCVKKDCSFVIISN
jgi:hypothetical protein